MTCLHLSNTSLYIKIKRVDTKCLQGNKGSAYNTDFIFKTNEKNNMTETVNAIFLSRNLKINEDKTGHTFPQRGDRNTKTWRKVQKVGSLLEDSDDIIRRKQLTISNMSNLLQTVQIIRNHINAEKILILYNCLVLPVLFDNFSI